MQKVLRFLLLFVIAIPAETSAVEPGTFMVGVHYEDASWRSVNMPSIGASVEYFINRGLSLNYRVAMGVTSRNDRYVHIPVGFLLAGSIFSAIDDDDAYDEGTCYDDYCDDCECECDTDYDDALYVIGGIASVLIPEGLAWHFYLCDGLRVSPYLNPLGIEIIDRSGDSGARALWSSEIGSRITIDSRGGLSLMASAGLRRVHENDRIWMNWSVGIGLRL